MTTKRVAVIGLAASGKSALIHRLKTGAYRWCYIPTWGGQKFDVMLETVPVTFVESRVDIVDGIIIGLARAYRDVDIVIVCICRVYRIECKRWKAVNFGFEFGNRAYRVVYTTIDRPSAIEPYDYILNSILFSAQSGDGIHDVIVAINGTRNVNELGALAYAEVKRQLKRDYINKKPSNVYGAVYGIGVKKAMARYELTI